MNLKTLGEKVGLEEEEYRELVELFIDTGMAEVEQLKSALVRGDSHQLARSAHTLNGAAGNMGFMEIHDLAKRIEQAANHDNLRTLADEVAALQRRFDDVAALLST